jgi:hypothetical protein
MESYSPNTKTKVEFSILADTQSAVLVVTDELDAVLLTHTLTEGEYSGVSFTHYVEPILNQINDGATKGLRQLCLTEIDSEGVANESVERYYLISKTPLVKNENSLVTFSEALFLVPELVQLDGWDLSDDSRRKAALIESFKHLNEFKLHANFLRKNVGDYPLEEFELLPTKFQEAFKKAQMLHADYLLGGQPEKSIRDTGQISRSVGESTTFFRTTKQLNYGISDKAYRYIVKYLNYDVRIVNG